MDFNETIKNFYYTLEKKEYVLGIVSILKDSTLYLDVYLDGNPISFHLFDGYLQYSYLEETYIIDIHYHNLHHFNKESINETNGYLVLERLKEGKIYYDASKRLSYYQKLLHSTFQNPLLKLYQKEKSHNDF